SFARDHIVSSSFPGKSRECTSTCFRRTEKRSSGFALRSSSQRTAGSLHARSPNLLESSRDGQMKSQPHGLNTSEVEVTNISRHGFWLWLGGRELFVPFSEFPWFADASVAKITKVEWPSQDHLYWPDLDVDLSVRSIEHPEEFPLKFRGA